MLLQTTLLWLERQLIIHCTDKNAVVYLNSNKDDFQYLNNQFPWTLSLCFYFFMWTHEEEFKPSGQPVLHVWCVEGSYSLQSCPSVGPRVGLSIGICSMYVRSMCSMTHWMVMSGLVLGWSISCVICITTNWFRRRDSHSMGTFCPQGLIIGCHWFHGLHCWKKLLFNFILFLLSCQKRFK